MSIEARVMIDCPDGYDVSSLITSINSMISNINGNHTQVNVVEIDNPISMSPAQMVKPGEKDE